MEVGDCIDKFIGPLKKKGYNASEIFMIDFVVVLSIFIPKKKKYNYLKQLFKRLRLEETNQEYKIVRKQQHILKIQYLISQLQSKINSLSPIILIIIRKRNDLTSLSWRWWWWNARFHPR